MSVFVEGQGEGVSQGIEVTREDVDVWMKKHMYIDVLRLLPSSFIRILITVLFSRITRRDGCASWLCDLATVMARGVMNHADYAELAVYELRVKDSMRGRVLGGSDELQCAQWAVQGFITEDPARLLGLLRDYKKMLYGKEWLDEFAWVKEMTIYLILRYPNSVRGVVAEASRRVQTEKAVNYWQQQYEEVLF